jgi:hypothetical protein
MNIGNETRPHRAIISINFEVHELLDNGACSGNAVHRDKKVLFFDGEDKFICIRNLNELLQELAKKCLNNGTPK